MDRNIVTEIMGVACTAGRIILENGGEIYRVEETMVHICNGFGLASCDCFATPTTLIVSVTDSDGEVHAQMMRICSRGIDLGKVEAVNRLSREIAKGPLTTAEARQRLARINGASPYPRWLTVLAAAVGTGAFTVVFGGGLRYFLWGLALGAVLHLLVVVLTGSRLGAFSTNLLGGAAAALGGWLLTALGMLSAWWIITLSALMLLAPGLLFTNALRDIAAGDLVSGVSRGIEAFSIAAALACGAAAMLMLLTQWGGM